MVSFPERHLAVMTMELEMLDGDAPVEDAADPDAPAVEERWPAPAAPVGDTGPAEAAPPVDPGHG